jgi:hypothetical protein
MRLKREISPNERMQPIFVSLIFSILVAHPSLVAWADGGALRLREKAGGYEIGVFTSPTPIRAGTIDVSVLVQDAATGEFVPNTKVTVCLKLPRSERILKYAATNEAATNKLFKAAVFNLSKAGSWDVDVAVEGPHGPAQVSFAVDANERLPRWREYWPWFTWPAAVIALFGAHQVIAVAKRKGFKQGERL